MAKLVLRNIVEGGSQGAALPSLSSLEPWVILSDQEGFSEGPVVLLEVSRLFWAM